MIDIWKQFWSGEGRIALSLCLLGMAFGLTIGIFNKDWGDSFQSIEIFGYQFSSPILFGAVVALATQIVSILLSWVPLYQGNESRWNNVIWLLTGLPIGILIVLNVFNGYLVALAFVIPYILNIILSPVVMMFVGWHTMHLFWFSAILLLPLYIISTGIIWSIESCRSLV